MLRKRSSCSRKSARISPQDDGEVEESHQQKDASILITNWRKLTVGGFAMCLYLVWVLAGLRHNLWLGTPSALAGGTPDAIVIGSGLAGLTTALTVVNRGGRVVLIEKEHTLGGNSKKASSGINACCGIHSSDSAEDSLDLFTKDTAVSAGSAAQPALIHILTEHSAKAVQWLQDELQLELDVVAQLGGHSVPRTHRPSRGMVGSELVVRLSQVLKQQSRQCTTLTDTTVTRLLYSADGRVSGVEYTTSQDPSQRHTLHAPNVILATGGFASDRSNQSWLSRVRPELQHFATTAGVFSTGDGITLGAAAGAATVDLEKIQLHPTGFVDPRSPTKGTKFLAAEVLRGVGGILINGDGKRFANELGLRSYLTDRMLQHDAGYLATGEWNVNTPSPVFGLVLSEAAASKARQHVDFYVMKGLLSKVVGIQAVADYLQVPPNVLQETIQEYRDCAGRGSDPFGKGVFPDTFDDGVFYVGNVTPVLHFCMGGLRIDPAGRVLNEHGLPIGGLFAAGEVAGGVHGDNRLGGNSLLECTVFGRIVGEQIPISIKLSRATHQSAHKEATSNAATTTTAAAETKRQITVSELLQHQGKSPCWVALQDRVYDLTAFAAEHAGGRDPIHLFCGKDATQTFHMIHSSYVMDRLSELPVVGSYVE